MGLAFGLRRHSNWAAFVESSWEAKGSTRRAEIPPQAEGLPHMTYDATFQPDVVERLQETIERGGPAVRRIEVPVYEFAN